MRFLVLLFLLFQAPVVDGKEFDLITERVECRELLINSTQIFRLVIYRSHHGAEVYLFCVDEETSKNTLVFEPYTLKNDENNRQAISLSFEQTVSLTNLGEKAFGYKMTPVKSGLDGSRWCLEYYRLSTYVNACFSNPLNNSERRGLEPLVQLARELWGVEEFEMNKESLY